MFTDNLFSYFFNDTATTEIYTLSLHDALPIWCGVSDRNAATVTRALLMRFFEPDRSFAPTSLRPADRKSTRLNSSHANISYAVFCLKNTNSFASFQEKT